MIRRLQLQNWRAYETLDLELGPGATFVVASNGIGKTSLILATAWGLFGEASEVEAVEEIRGDADAATVRVDVRFPSGADVSITRSINRKGRATLTAELDSRTLSSQRELDDLFSNEFGAESHVLAQLTVMTHGGAVATYHGEFDLQDHLAGVFGVSSLFEAANVAKGIADRAASAQRKLKTTRRIDMRARDEVTVELESTDRELELARGARTKTASVAEDLAAVIRLGEEWSRFGANLSERKSKLSSLAEHASTLLEQFVDAKTLLEVLEDAERDLDRSISTAESEAASARGKSELINSAISDLEDAESTCPTCLRPLSEQEAVRAEDAHRAHLRELASFIVKADSEIQTKRGRLSEVRQLLRQVRTLPVPLQPQAALTDEEFERAKEALQERKAEIEQLDQRVALLTNSKQALERALKELDEDEQQIRQLEEMYRQEGVARAAHHSFAEIGKAITKMHIEPLAQEIEMRWKRVFGTGGLNLSPEGRITRKVGTRLLKFESLSGGEKVWALLLTRLLMAGTSTKASFVWLDEPLEHLDPRLRKVVAGTLAKASSGVGLRQVIVTTYESELARQLMEDVPSASLIYVTAS